MTDSTDQCAQHEHSSPGYEDVIHHQIESEYESERAENHPVAENWQSIESMIEAMVEGSQQDATCKEFADSFESIGWSADFVGRAIENLLQIGVHEVRLNTVLFLIRALSYHGQKDLRRRLMIELVKDPEETTINLALHLGWIPDIETILVAETVGFHPKLLDTARPPLIAITAQTESGASRLFVDSIVQRFRKGDILPAAESFRRMVVFLNSCNIKLQDFGLDQPFIFERLRDLVLNCNLEIADIIQIMAILLDESGLCSGQEENTLILGLFMTAVDLESYNAIAALCTRNRSLVLEGVRSRGFQLVQYLLACEFEGPEFFQMAACGLASRGDVEDLKTLRGLRGDKNFRDDLAGGERSALMFAADSKSEPAIQLLLDAGAQIWHRGQFYLDWACPSDAQQMIMCHLNSQTVLQTNTISDSTLDSNLDDFLDSI